MPRSIQFLSVDDVLAIHADTIAVEGGSAGLRDPGLLESAVMMPRQRFGGRYLHPSLATMAAAYLFHIASNHPLLDGNKRAAAMAALVFLDANGSSRLPRPDELTEVALHVAAGEWRKEKLTAWMEKALSGS